MTCWRVFLLCSCCLLSAAWPTHGGSCFTADNGHVRRSLGTGGYALTLLQEEATERDGAAWLQLRLHDEQDAAPLRGFVVKALGGSGMIFPGAQLGAGQQNLDCGDGGAKEEAVTHTARRSKPTVTLEARVPQCVHWRIFVCCAVALVLTWACGDAVQTFRSPGVHYA